MSWWIPLLQAGAGIYAANKASDAVERGADQAADTSQRQYDQTRADLAPYREVGGQALNAYSQALGLPGTGANQFTSGGTQDLFGDGNVPLSEEGVKAAYRQIYGREADPEGLQFHMTRGQRGATPSGVTGPLGVGPGSTGGNESWQKLLKFGANANPFYDTADAPPRGAFTYNEFLEKARTSSEYEDKRSRGILPPGSPLATSEAETANFTGSELLPQNREAFNQSQQQEGPTNQYAGFEASPGYQWRQDQGAKQINRYASARGYAQSPRRDLELQRQGQGEASAEFANYMNRLSNAAGLGQTSTVQTGQFGAQNAYNVGNAQQNAGNARASGYLGAANTLINAGNNYQASRPWMGGNNALSPGTNSWTPQGANDFGRPPRG